MAHITTPTEATMDPRLMMVVATFTLSALAFGCAAWAAHEHDTSLTGTALGTGLMGLLTTGIMLVWIG